MGPTSTFLVLALALVNTVRSSPVALPVEAAADFTASVNQETLERAQCESQACVLADLSGSSGRELPTITNRNVLSILECRGQSCLLADTAGTTGRGPTMRAEGASDADIKCIAAHNPEVGELLQKYSNKPPEVPKQDTGIVSTAMIGLNSIWRPLTAARGSTEKGEFKGNCSENILIFAKGTFEPGTYGVFVGPSFTSGLPAGWSTAGVSYDVDVPGDFCLGLPGGMVAKDVINGAAKKCPKSNLFVSGYSQGAMAIRNGLARAGDSAKAKVKGVVTFGDPFNGANIKGYNGPIAIFCNKGDGVCTGNFELAPGHLTYGVDTSAGLAQKALLKMAAGQGDDSCCKPRPAGALPSPEEWAASIKANGGKIPKAKNGTSIDEWEKALLASKGGIPKGSVVA